VPPVLEWQLSKLTQRPACSTDRRSHPPLSDECVALWMLAWVVLWLTSTFASPLGSCLAAVVCCCLDSAFDLWSPPLTTLSICGSD